MKKQTFIGPVIFILLSGAVICFCSFQNRQERRELAFEATIKDSIPVQIDLIFDKDNSPEGYYSRIKTPVCEDTLCYLVTIDLYWDLLGNFRDYKTPRKSPLTKFDHIRFSKNDHTKMKSILRNRESSLRDHAVETLLDPERKKQSAVVVDGVSGATNIAVKDEVVEGALYSTYTLWHIVNGDIAQKIQAHSKPLIDGQILRKMLASDNADYQYYALDQITNQDFDQYAALVIRLVSEGSSYVPYFAIEKIPANKWASEPYQLSLVKLLGKVEFKMQNEILNKLKDIPLSQSAKDVLVANMSKLNENQKQKVLSKLSANPNP